MQGAGKPTVAAVLAVIAVREVAAVGVAVRVGRHGVTMVAGSSECVCVCICVCVCRRRCLGVEVLLLTLTVGSSQEDRCGQWLCISVFIADACVVHLV